VSVIAYADDVMIFVTKPEDFCIIRDAVHCFEKASGAHLNVRKSKALAVGGWEEAGNDLGVEYHQSIKILGINFSSMSERTMHKNWALQKARVKTNAKQVLWMGPMSSTNSALRTHRSSSHNLVYSSNPPSPCEIYTTVDDCNTMVHLAGSNIPGAHNYTPETNDPSGMGFTQRGEQV